MIKEKTKLFFGGLEPGDVILIEGSAKWYQIGTKFIHMMIRWYQRRLFGRKSNWKDTHAMLYLTPHFVFSMDFPHGKWEKIQHVLERKFSVYRGRYVRYEKFRCELWEIAHRIVPRSYDVGDLLDFLISGILGYTRIRKIRIFEFSRRHMTCSVAVRAIFERLRKDEELKGNFLIPRLFDKIDVEMTTPAHFANSCKYACEFTKIADWRHLN